jgi:hypothetical protein
MGWGTADDTAFADAIGDVVPVGTEEEVGRSNACWDVAVVADVFTGRDLAAGDCPSVAMSGEPFATFDGAITDFGVDFGCPDPAGTGDFVDFSPEAWVAGLSFHERYYSVILTSCQNDVVWRRER